MLMRSGAGRCAPTRIETNLRRSRPHKNLRVSIDVAPLSTHIDGAIEPSLRVRRLKASQHAGTDLRAYIFTRLDQEIDRAALKLAAVIADLTTRFTDLDLRPAFAVLAGVISQAAEELTTLVTTGCELTQAAVNQAVLLTIGVRTNISTSIAFRKLWLSKHKARIHLGAWRASGICCRLTAVTNRRASGIRLGRWCDA